MTPCDPPRLPAQNLGGHDPQPLRIDAPGGAPLIENPCISWNNIEDTSNICKYACP